MMGASMDSGLRDRGCSRCTCCEARSGAASARGTGLPQRVLDRLSESQEDSRKVRRWSFAIAGVGAVGLLASAYRFGAGDAWGAYRELNGAMLLFTIAVLGNLLYHTTMRKRDEALERLARLEAMRDDAGARSGERGTIPGSSNEEDGNGERGKGGEFVNGSKGVAHGR